MESELPSIQYCISLENACTGVFVLPLVDQLSSKPPLALGPTRLVLLNSFLFDVRLKANMNTKFATIFLA